MAKRSGVGKVFTIIGILLLAILLCYFSIAIYLYFANSNNISSKLKVWNLMSDQSVGELYLDASFSISNGEDSFYGVNVHENGYVLTIASNVEEDETYTLYQKNGKVYRGEVVFLDTDINLALIKLYSFETEKTISLPFVAVGDLYSSSLTFNSTYIAVGDPLLENNVSTINDLEFYTYAHAKTKLVDGKEVVEYVNTSPYYYSIENYSTTSQGGVFNKKGELLGLVYDYSISPINTNNANYFILDVDVMNFILDDVVSSTSYENNLVSSVVGFDMYELQCYLDYPLTSSSDYIYFNGQWMQVPENVINLYYSGVDGVYLTEDFVYNGTTIPANCFITSLNYNLFSYNIYTKADLLYILYSLESGDALTLTYQNLATSEISRTRITVE